MLHHRKCFMKLLLQLLVNTNKETLTYFFALLHSYVIYIIIIIIYRPDVQLARFTLLVRLKSIITFDPKC